MAYVAVSSGVKVKITTRMRSGQTVVTSKLWPETDLSVVNAVTLGGVYIDGNTIGFNPAVQNLVSSGGMTDWVGSNYCPLVKVVAGGTQYADMFVRGGTATVTPVPGSVGYGTLDNAWNVSTHIPAPPFDEHTSRSLPTVPAVASAIDEAIYGMTTGISGAYVRKTDSATTASHGIVVVPADHGLSINGGTLSMNVAQVVGNYTDAETLVTAGNAGGVVIMNTIAGATTGQANLAVAPTVDAVANAIDAEGARLTVWVRNNFMSNTYVPPPTPINYAGYGTYGIVSIQRYGGIVVNNGVLTVDTATTTQKGGVVIKDTGGIDVDGGTISIKAATVYADITAATAGTGYGGVRVISKVTEPTSNNLKNLPIVPNNEAVWNAAYGYNKDFTCTKSGNSISVSTGTVYINGTTISGTCSPSGTITFAGSALDIWLNVTYDPDNTTKFTGTVTTTRSTNPGVQSILLAKYDADGTPTRCHRGPLAWDIDTAEYDGQFAVHRISNSEVRIDNGSIYIAGYTDSWAGLSGSNYEISNGEIWLQIAVTNQGAYDSSNSGYASSWNYSATKTSIPIAKVTGNIVTQYQHGPIVLPGLPGSIAGQGNSGYTGPFAASVSQTNSVLIKSGYVYDTDGTRLLTTTDTNPTLTGATVGDTIYLHVDKTNPTMAYTITKGTTTATDKYFPIALLGGSTAAWTATQIQYGNITWPAESGGQDYFGDFKCDVDITAGTISATTGTVYTDRGISVFSGTPTVCTIPSGTTVGTAWLVLTKTGAVYYADIALSPSSASTSAAPYSVPLAGFSNSTVCQYQYGPVVIRGRWT